MFMIRSRRSFAPGQRSQGFSLIELMVAMVLGLIVIAAVVNLVMSIIQANNQSIQATRLTQELRATTQVIANDIKRARTVQDPFRSHTPVGGVPANQYYQVDATVDKCVKYSYYSADPGVTNYFHSISLSNTNPGAIIRRSADQFDKLTCRGTDRSKDVWINSRLINIEDLRFVRSGRRITITVVGSLVDNPSIKRTLTQDIFIRSLAGG